MRDIPLHKNPSNQQLLVKEIAHKNPYDFNRVHRHAYFELFLFQSAGGHQLIDFSNIPIEGKSVYAVHPKQVHHMQRLSSANGLVIQFSEEMLLQKTWLNSIPKISRLPQIPQDTFDSLYESTQRLYSILQGNQKSKIRQGQHLLHIIILELGEFIFASSEEKSRSNELDQAIAYIDNNFIEVRSAEAVANTLNVSLKSLNSAFKKHLGTSCLKYMHERMLLEIKRRLTVEKTSLKEISYDLGFDNPANFSAFVKKHTEMTPSQLRINLAEIHK